MTLRTIVEPGDIATIDVAPGGMRFVWNEPDLNNAIGLIHENELAFVVAMIDHIGRTTRVLVMWSGGLGWVSVHSLRPT